MIPQFPSTSHRLSLPAQRSLVWPIHDLVINELLVWILPTHRRTLLMKFITVILLVVGVVVGKLLQWNQFHGGGIQWLSLVLLISAATLFLLYWCYYYRRVLMELYFDKDCWWMDPYVTDHLRLPMHVPMRSYETEDQARHGACCIVHTDSSPNVYCLDGLPWKFSLQDTVRQGLAAVHLDTEDGTFQGIKIPSNWTMVDTVADGPIYTNQKYPFPCQPPLVPYQNPTGVYRLEDFDVPDHWQDDVSSFTILLHGIESAAYVYCNKQLVGFTKDSRLPAEFDVTQFLRLRNNTIDIVVIRWSDGSYVEDQDHWWMAGTCVSFDRYFVHLTMSF